jgi:predicted XRE-type DNA-binding protein
MSKELYTYDVYDKIDKKYIMENVTSAEIAEELNIPKSRISNYVQQKIAVNRRYVISRLEVDADSTEILIDEKFKYNWDKYRTLANRALRNPRAVDRFLVKVQSKAGCM